ALRRMAYPDPALERVTDGSQVRFATTDDFLRIAEAASGMELDWFFETYLRQPALPRLAVEQARDGWTLRWESPNNLPFPMPVEVEINGERRRIAMTNGQAHLSAARSARLVVDPDGWILRAAEGARQR
ncbi:MAG TPA: hypothetical protein VGR27_12935, partial [Longimicrobiaceae bacterium]|nr:hypothetical protein [Longimicrobiaceae bacterium]